MYGLEKTRLALGALCGHTRAADLEKKEPLAPQERQRKRAVLEEGKK